MVLIRVFFSFPVLPMTTLMERDNAPPAVVRQSVLMRVSRTYVWGVSLANIKAALCNNV